MVGEFDIGALRRVRKQTERNAIQDGTYTGGFENDHAVTESPCYDEELFVSYQDEEEGSESNFSVYSCVSGSDEAEVQGEVALRDETVPMHTADLCAVGAGEHMVSCAGEGVKERGTAGHVDFPSIIAHST